MTILEILRVLVTAYAAVWGLYVVLIPVVGAGRRRSDKNGTKEIEDDSPSIAAIIPARNMARSITRCIRSLQECQYPEGKLEIYVVADHCTDDTADLARAAGAQVFVRQTEPAGKTFALAWTLEQLERRGRKPFLYLVVDATARVDSGFLDAMVNQWRKDADIVVGHPIVDPENKQWFAQCLGLTLAHRNLQNRARERLKLSVLLEGRGMAYSREYIKRFGWRLALPKSSRGTHPTEDWRHAVNAVGQGYRVSFADDALVITPLRESLAAATRQGIRWEHGRMANAMTHAVRLLLRGIRERNLMKVLAAVDAIQPPVAILGAVCLAAALLSLGLSQSSLSLAFGLTPLLLIGTYALFVVFQGRRDGVELTAVLWAPAYIAWRCLAFLIAWTSFGRLRFSTRKNRHGHAES